jgi:hypothetical protein
MKFLRSLDLYKVIILLSVVLLPAAGFWCKGLAESIALCRTAIHDATRPGGRLEEIGSLQKQIEVVAQNRMSNTDQTLQPQKYFETQILAAAGGQGLKSDDFVLTGPKEEAAMTGSKQRAADFVIDVDWKRRNELPVSLAFVYAVLFNCESGAGTSGERAGLQSIWKLRELKLTNATDDKLATNFRTPPPELEDRWKIESMKFVRREPRAR